jgi:hypothetical protein
MRVNREFKSSDVVRALENIDELELAALLRGEVLDAELTGAIRHGQETDGYGDLISAKDYLAGKH